MSIIGFDIPDQFASNDLRLRELERRTPFLADDGDTGPCEGAVKLYNQNNQTVPGSAFAPYRLLFGGAMYACTASPLVSGDGFQVERDGVWHVTCTLQTIASVDVILEVWTNHGSTDFIFCSDYRSAAETGDSTRLHASEDIFLNAYDSVWAVVYPTASTAVIVRGEPQYSLAAHLVSCNCSTSCNWVETCSGWTITCT